MTVEEFEAEINEFGQNLESMIDAVLLSVGGDIVDDIKSGIPVNSGALRNSVQARVQDESLFIEMLYYGMFQNYGVDGTDRRVADRVPFGISNQPTAGSSYGFSDSNSMIGGDLNFGARKKIHRLGIKPQRFFDLEHITDLVVARLENEITEQI